MSSRPCAPAAPGPCGYRRTFGPRHPPGDGWQRSGGRCGSLPVSRSQPSEPLPSSEPRSSRSAPCGGCSGASEAPPEAGRAASAAAQTAPGSNPARPVRSQPIPSVRAIRLILSDLALHALKNRLDPVRKPCQEELAPRAMPVPAFRLPVPGASGNWNRRRKGPAASLKR